MEIHLMILTNGERSEGEVSDSLIRRAVPLIGFSIRLDVALFAAEPTEDANDDAGSPKADLKKVHLTFVVIQEYYVVLASPVLFDLIYF